MLLSQQKLEYMKKEIIMKKLIILASLTLVCMYGQDWERIVEEYVDGVYLQGAYSGGVNYSRPYWVDIDNDSDYDLFIGGEHGGMHFYRNIGSPLSASWLFITEYFEDIDIGNRSSQAFADIDGDNDFDLFIGEQRGAIYYYRNDGTPSVDSFVFITDNYEGIDVGSYSAPFFCDIDDDGDVDMFIGEHTGNINYYRNDGTATSPSWTYVTDTWFGIDVGTKNIPWFADIDADNDYDLFIGYSEGTTYFYRNDGTAASPNMVYVTDNYISDVGNTNAPTFADIDNDGDLDFFVGEYIGNVNYWRNIGTPANASWTFVRRNYLIIDLNSSCTPVLVDIDADGDYDLFSGEWVGFIDFFRNTGTLTDHRWNLVSENYGGIDVGDNSAPTFVDIDNDNDFDLFIGNLEGNVYYYRNDGTITVPNFALVSSNYNGIDVGDRGAPTFADIDDDNDFDLFLGNLVGRIWYYRNDGTASAPNWTFVTDNYEGIDIGDQSIPTFADVDRDGDYDLFIGEAMGTIYYYQNDGTASAPSFSFITNEFAGINVEENTAPTFIDIDDDEDLDLFIGERWGGLNHYLQIPLDSIPPNPPYIYGQKSGGNVYLYWHPVTDTAGNPESVHHYVVYRNTSPYFIPSPGDSIGIASAPETTFTDIGALAVAQSYYYLVKAVDVAFNRSRKSNMGYKLNKFFNENSGTTSDRNLTSIPWHSEYMTVADLTDDISLLGIPLTEITNLRDDQLYESWIYDDFFGWFGTDFSITPGRGYEAITDRDTTLVIVGSNNPDGEITLNENSGTASDRNWVSIPYNGMYTTVSAITDEYSPVGVPLIEITNLREDQLYESWIYDNFFGWFGTDYPIAPGRGYEMVTIVDTLWNPTEYSNVFFNLGPVKIKQPEFDICLGYQTVNDRLPVWNSEDGFCSVYDGKTGIMNYRIAGTSHIVCVNINVEDLERLLFTAYRVNDPVDALTEIMIGCGTIQAETRALAWFNTGNFLSPWKDGEEIIVIVEVRVNGQNYVAVTREVLSSIVDIQYIKELSFQSIPEPVKSCERITWTSINDENIIGYSLYNHGVRINNSIVTEDHVEVDEPVSFLKLVFVGGHESVMDSRVLRQESSQLNYAFSLHPNPFNDLIKIEYAIPIRTEVKINIYDITGREVKTLVAQPVDPGAYEIMWTGSDNRGRQVNAGVYFIDIRAGEFQNQYKVVFVR